MSSALQTSEELECNQPAADNDDAGNGCEVDIPHVVADTEYSSVEEKGTQFGKGEGAAYEEDDNEIKLSCVNEHTVAVRGR